MSRNTCPQIPPSDAARVEALRRRCLARKPQPRQDSAPTTARSLQASEALPWRIRCGLRCRDRLSALRLAVDELDLLAGRLAGPDETPAGELQAAREAVSRHMGLPGQTGHCELDRSVVLSAGIDGVRRRIEECLGAAGESPSAGDGDTYRSFLYALEGLSALCVNAAAVAEAAMADAPPWRQAELREMADSCRHVAHHPPRTFRDAVQLLWLTDVGVMWGDSVGLVVPGHLDRTLWPFYQADLAAGRITRDGALLLLEALYVLVNDFIPDGLAMSVMVGGVDERGGDVTNDLSYLCLEALRRTRMIYPTVGVCWHTGTPGELTDLAVELISRGYTTPAFFNDAVIQKGLADLAVPPSQRCLYINSTCVEITPSGSSNVWVASPYFPLCTFLLEEIAAQVASGRPEGTFDAFLDSYRQRLAGKIAAAAAEQNRSRQVRRDRGGKPLQSVFTRDCIARGRDIDDGGALYNWVECSFVGLANLADSLYVVEQEVYRQKRLTLAELKSVLDADFAGQEAVRQRFLNGYPKYGNACAEVDRFVPETVDFCRAQCRRQRMVPGDSPLVPGSFCWIMHEQLGRQAGATPDGRKAGFPYADGAGPAQGREGRGPTAGILSTTSWDHSPMIGGLAYNMKFSASLFQQPGARDRLADLIRTYLQRGGFEVQVNVVDLDTLRKARAHPDQYRDLTVRIGGYVDYFTRLSPQMQDEVMLRTEFQRF